MLSETGTRWHRAPGPPGRRLANLLQMASSYREGREWSCECHYCRLLRAFATIWPITGREVLSPSRYRPAGRTRPRWRSGRTTPPTAATCALGKGAGRFNVAPAVEGCLRCRSANQAGWRSENPLPELADHPHGARAPTFSSSPGSAGRRRWGGRRAVSDRQAEPGRDTRQRVTVHPGSRCRAGCRRGAVGNRETNTTGGSDR